MRQTTTAEVRLDQGKTASSGAVRPSDSPFWLPPGRPRSNFVAGRLDEAENHAQQPGNPGNVGLQEMAKNFVAGAAVALALTTPAFAQTPGEQFAHGLQDRTRWEMWFASLSGDMKAGAEYWAGQRSLPHPGKCTGTPDFSKGCNKAKARLTDSDALRKFEPDYKGGWNSYVQPATPPAPPAAPAAAEPSQPATVTVTPDQIRARRALCRLSRASSARHRRVPPRWGAAAARQPRLRRRRQPVGRDPWQARGGAAGDVRRRLPDLRRDPGGAGRPLTTRQAPARAAFIAAWTIVSSGPLPFLGESGR